MALLLTNSREKKNGSEKNKQKNKHWGIHDDSLQEAELLYTIRIEVNHFFSPKFTSLNVAGVCMLKYCFKFRLKAFVNTYYEDYMAKYVLCALNGKYVKKIP